MELKVPNIGKIEEILSKDVFVVGFHKGDYFEMPFVDNGLFNGSSRTIENGLEAIRKYISAPYYSLNLNDSSEYKAWKRVMAQQHFWFNDFDNSTALSFNSIFGVNMHLEFISRQYIGEEREKLSLLYDQVKACQNGYMGEIGYHERAKRIDEIKNVLKQVVNFLSEKSKGRVNEKVA